MYFKTDVRLNYCFMRMFNVFRFTLLLFVFSNITAITYAQWGLTKAEIQSSAQGETINLLNPNSNVYTDIFSGLINGIVDGNQTQFYSTKICTEFKIPDSSYTDSELFGGDIYYIFTYIINNYYPYKTSYPGKLENLDDECSAIQIALWKFSDSLNVNSVSNELIKNRALSIISDALLHSTSVPFPLTLDIVNDINPEFFKVKTTDESGNGISVDSIELQLTMSDGYLSTNNVNTINGFSVPVEVIGSGVGLIFATGNCLFPQGSHFKSRNNSVINGLLLALPVIGKMTVNYDWGTLPVELTSFTYSINKSDLTLYWTTVTEINNSRFEIERSTVSGEWSKVGSLAGAGNSTVSKSYSFTDKNLAKGVYNYRLKQIDFNGNFEYFSLSDKVEVGTPGIFELSQNYPNPFNPSTKINYSLAKDGFVSIKIFDNAGRQIASLVNEFKNSGFYTVDFNAADLSSGIYFYKLVMNSSNSIEANDITNVRKMILLK
ncbi:MAG TPA: T9SS type A sorting domain-containing protein [Ignavibacteria bacterium]|nr:T9SS type A sorting domain-containing protein [Ignavibacteria bacterium]